MTISSDSSRRDFLKTSSVAVGAGLVAGFGGNAGRMGITDGGLDRTTVVGGGSG